MKIKKLVIYGYGKWIDQTFDLNEDIQIFLGENEAGKSTLMSFIHSIFFGFPTRNSILLRYEPLESSRYGGKIILEDARFGKVVIERIHGKVTGDVTVTLEDGSIGSDALLEKVLRGIDQESYRSIFSFSLTDIENVHQLNKNNLSRYLLNIGAHSTDYYLDLVDEFEKDAYNLYRPSGRIPPLNKELSAIKKQEKKLKKIEKNNESYLSLIQKNNEQDQELTNIEEKIEQKNKKIKNLKELKKDLHLLEEIQGLRKAINETQLPYLKKDGRYLLEENKKTIKEMNQELNDINQQTKEIEKTIGKKEKIYHYQENKKEIKDLEQKLPDKVEDIEKLKKIETKIKENKRAAEDTKIRLKMEKGKNEPIQLTKQKKEAITEITKSYADLKNQMANQKQKNEMLENKIIQKNEKADYYEELMWDSQYLMSVKNQMNEKDNTKSKQKKQSFKTHTLFSASIAIILMILSVYLSADSQFFVAGIASIIFLFSIVYYLRKNKEYINEDQASLDVNPPLIKEYNNQMKLQKDWQNLLAEIDSIQKDYQENKEEINKNNHLRKEMNKEWRILVNSLDIPPIHPIEESEELLEQVAEWNSRKKKMKELTAEKIQLSQKLTDDFKVLREISSEYETLSFVEIMHHFRHYLKEINDLIDLEQSKMSRIRVYKEKEKELSNKKKVLKAQNNQLISVVGAETEEEFYSLYQEKKELDKKKSRLQFLMENTPDFDANKKIPSKKELLAKIETTHSDLKKLIQKNKKLIDERAKTKVNIHQLEKDGRYSEALQEFENQKAITQNLVDEWITNKLAAAIIKSTLNQVTEDRFNNIIKEINEYFNYLTNQRYSNILFEEEELFVQSKEGRVIEVKTLSRGTAEPLYVAIRLAYIIKMQDVVGLPIIMDDPFVNFDKERKDRINQLLNQLGETIQIIYFSFDLSLEETFSNEKIIYLKQ